MRDMPFPVPMAVSSLSIISCVLRSAAGVPLGLVERGEESPWEQWERERECDRGRDDSGRLRRASAIAELRLRECGAWGVSRFGSSMMEVGDCTIGMSSLVWRESVGDLGDASGEPSGRGFRLMELLLVGGDWTLCVEDSDGVVMSEVLDTLSNVVVVPEASCAVEEDDSVLLLR